MPLMTEEKTQILIHNSLVITESGPDTSLKIILNRTQLS